MNQPQPLVLKAEPPQLPARPVDVPAPSRVKIAISVPSAAPLRQSDNPAVQLRLPFVLKFEWEGFTVEFEQDGSSVRPFFRGPCVLDHGGFPRPTGWSNIQAQAALRWACACWAHLNDVSAASAASWLALYSQTAGVAVWNVLEAFVEASQAA